MDYTKQVKQLVIEKGANLIGIADLKHFWGNLPVIPENLLNSFKFGVSFAVKFNYEIIDRVKDKPTQNIPTSFPLITKNVKYIMDDYTLLTNSLNQVSII